MGGLIAKLSVVVLCLALTPWSAGQGQFTAPGIGFRNDSKVAVIVQGWSVVNNMPRRGQPLLIQPDKRVWDNNVPPGIRYYSVYDANQPSKVLLRDFPVPVGTNDQFFAIRPVPSNPSRVLLQREPLPPIP